MVDQYGEFSVNFANEADDYDSPWKDAVEHYFPAFMAVVRDAELGKRFVDKLIRVSLRNGDEKWIYIHIEIQGTKQAEFAKCMFVYNYRLFDRYDRPVASMAVLADTQPDWKPISYGFEVLGCKHFLEFPVVKLTDYHNQLDKLLIADNVFAGDSGAYFDATQRTQKNDDERYEAKRLLMRLLYQRNWALPLS